MARLRAGRGSGPLNPDQDYGPDGEAAPPPTNYPGGNTPSDPGGNATKPIELNPGAGAPTHAPTPGSEPPVNTQPVGNSPLVSPPSPTNGNNPMPILPSPPPQAMVFPRSPGGGKLFGARGGQFGGGLTLGAENAVQGEQDPSDLISSLMMLLNGQQ